MDDLRSDCGGRPDAAISDRECPYPGQAVTDRSRWRKLQLLDILADEPSVAGDPCRVAPALAALALAYARDLPQRSVAVRVAMAMGMPLSRIEEYLDWLDARRSGRN